jgi:hypothetical protein
MGALKSVNFKLQPDGTGLYGMVHYSSGPFKRVTFGLNPMKMNGGFVGIDGTEPHWSNFEFSVLYRIKH